MTCKSRIGKSLEFRGEVQATDRIWRSLAYKMVLWAKSPDEITKGVWALQHLKVKEMRGARWRNLRVWPWRDKDTKEDVKTDVLEEGVTRCIKCCWELS